MNLQKACDKIGIQCRQVPADGKFHPVPVADKPSTNTSGRIKLFPDGKGGVLLNHVSGDRLLFWHDETPERLTSDERERRKSVAAEQARQLEEERVLCRLASQRELEKVPKAPADHPYLMTAKGIPAIGAFWQRQGNRLLIPVCDFAGTVHGIQYIDAAGEKRFKPGTVKAGHFFIITGNDTVVVCEGYATGVSIHLATGATVLVAFDAGNLAAVAQAARERHPDNTIIIAADDDHATAGNPGLTKATAAAQAVNGLLAVPVFPEDRQPKQTDFNDLHQASGLDRVREIIKAATFPSIASDGVGQAGAIPTPCPQTETQPQDKPEDTDTPNNHKEDQWPELHSDALPGWIGDFVWLACDHSEADPAAVLITLLTRFASEAGSDPFVNIGDAKHRARINGVIVGASSKARKGTSAKPVERVFADIPTGARCSPGPLSSGEGLIYAVRDSVMEWDRKTEDYVVTDPGVDDKRLFILDEEFAAALNCTKREGNTLSAIIRGFYDDGNAEPLTKTSRIKATGAHVCILTHIVQLELTNLLDSVQMSNGFGNRFLWILARRQRLIALPAPMPDLAVKRLSEIIKERINKAMGRKVVRMSTAATSLWIESYPSLTMDYAGVAGSVVNRSEAHAIRLALIYSLMLGHDDIEVEDLKAAFAVVDYSRQSAFRIFGSAPSDRRKSKIIDALKDAPGNELTLTYLNSQVFQRHIKSEELEKIISEMAASRLILVEKIPTGGAPKTKIKLNCSREKSELSEISQIYTPLNSLNSLNSQAKTVIFPCNDPEIIALLPE